MSHTILLSIPNLRRPDLTGMPHLQALTAAGELASLEPSFPCVTCPVQANMTTGKLPSQHGVVANGFYWRDKGEVEMWTAWNDCIQAPQIWDLLHQHDPEITSAVWFPLHSKGAEADYICTPAPIHNPDGTESLWCYTRPSAMYGELRDALDHFPLKHFWGPLANIKSTDWIVDSAVWAAREHCPQFFYIYLPHLDYAAQKYGPNSPQAMQSIQELDLAIGRLAEGFAAAYADLPLTWLIASEYTIQEVNHVAYPNRILREAGWLSLREQTDGEYLDVANSRAWALVDHQFSHIFLKDRAGHAAEQVASLFHGLPGIAEVLVGQQAARYDLCHERSGDVILVSEPHSWQAYYWWQADNHAPGFASTVDIHRKPGYDPVELHVDMATRTIPLNANLVKGSHGTPEVHEEERGVLLSSRGGVIGREAVADTDVFNIVLRQYGM